MHPVMYIIYFSLLALWLIVGMCFVRLMDMSLSHRLSRLWRIGLLPFGLLLIFPAVILTLWYDE